jgi:predicted ATPase/DNA-binding XRE family transcriptional regulator
MTARDSSSFAHLLRDLRLAHGLSQEALAEQSGISTDAIRALERGRRTAPRASTLALLADALDLSLDDRAALVAAATSERPASALKPPPVPRPPDPLIGRECELAEIAACFSDGATRLVTLTGPGGVGKTRLALEVLVADCRGGVFVDLAPVRDPALAPTTIARAAGARDSGQHDPWQRLLEAMGESAQLFVLDNFEQIVEAAPSVSELLAAAPHVRVLVTSRMPLRIRGEQCYPVAPLDAGPAGDGVGSPAVRLFVARARAVVPHFTPDAAAMPAIAAICQRLNGLPLAIELAAARVRMLTPDELRTRLEPCLPLLTGGGRDLPERQRTIRATIGWSYGLLAPEEQRFFRQMAVFVGGFTLETAELLSDAVGDGLDPITGIAALVDHSLVRLQPGGGEARYTMLETIREFGLEHLAATSEEEAVRIAHAHAMLALARRVVPDFHLHPAYETVARLDDEIGNIRAALTWLAQTGRVADLADLVLQLRWLWSFTYVPEGLRWHETLLAAPGIAAHPGRAEILREAGQLAITLTPTSAAGIAYLDQARALFHEMGETISEAKATLLLGIAAEDAGEPAAAEARFREARSLWERLGNEQGIAVVDYHLGIVAYGQGNLDAAVALLNRASTTATAVGDHMVSVWCSWYLAMVACAQGAPARAAAVLAGPHRDVARALGQSLHWATHFAAAAVLAATVREDDIAARLFGALTAESEHDPLGWPESVAIERAAAAVRARLGGEADDEARQLGARLPAVDVVAEIDQVLERAAAAPATRSAVGNES